MEGLNKACAVGRVSLCAASTAPFSDRMIPPAAPLVKAIFRTKLAAPTECASRSMLETSHSTTPVTEQVSVHCTKTVSGLIA